MEVSMEKILISIIRERLFNKIALYKMLTDEQAKEIIDDITQTIGLNKLLMTYITERNKNRDEVIEYITMNLEPLLRLVHSTDKVKVKREISISFNQFIPRNIEQAVMVTNNCIKCGERISQLETVCFICIASEGTEFRKGYMIKDDSEKMEQDKRLIRAYISKNRKIDISDIPYDICNKGIITKLK